MSNATPLPAADFSRPGGYRSSGLSLQLYYAFAATLAVCLVIISENIYFRDYGDFSRAIGFMLSGVQAEPHLLWPFKVEGIGKIEGLDISAGLFKLFGTIQSWYSDFYSLQVNSIFAKLVLLVYADVLAKLISRHFKNPMLSRAIGFTCVCLSFFYAHNIGITKSFYTEYSFFIFFPLLLIGFLQSAFNYGKLLIIAGSVLCGLSKVQYFYIPVLVFICVVVVNHINNLRTPLWLVAGLCLAQAVCMVPMARNPYAELNHHQATYFGAYLVLSQAQLRGLGLNDEQRACVGIDGWGHKALGPGGTQPQYVGGSCYKRYTSSTKDVLLPYWRYPATLYELMRFSLPYHFTTNYTHVFAHFPYITPANGKSFKGGNILIALTQLREKTITQISLILISMGLVLPFLRLHGRHKGLGLSSLFLALFIISQVIISLLGEGIRDLSKHLWAAQLALDFLVLALLAQCIIWVNTYRHTKQQVTLTSGDSAAATF